MFDDGKEVFYDADALSDLQLAYAMTVHKSQGCEFDTVFIMLGKVNVLLKQRRLLYTAVTRGRNRVVIVDTGNTLPSYINNRKERIRLTSLSDLLKSASDER